MNLRNAFIITAAAGLFAVGMLGTIDYLGAAYFKNDAKEDLRAEIEILAGRLEQSINHRLQLTRGLAAFVRSNPKFSEDDFQTFANALSVGQKGILSLQLAPQGIVQYFTNKKENAKAFGHDLRADPQRREFVNQSITSREYLIVGPIDLVQGGQAVVARLPIFQPQSHGDDSFWGFSTILIDPKVLLQEAGFFAGFPGVELALRGKDGLGPKGDVIFGSLDVFDSPLVEIRVSLPSGSWVIGAKQGGTFGYSDLTLRIWFWVGGSLLIVMSLITLFSALRRPEHLRMAVQNATKDLLKSEKRFADFADIASDWLWEMDEELRFTFLSDRVEAVTGVPVDFHIGKTREDLSDEDYQTEKWQNLRDAMAAKKPFKDFQFLRKSPDGVGQYISTSGVPLYDGRGHFIGYRGTAIDITEFKQASMTIEILQKQLADAIEAMPDAFVYFDKDDRLIICNQHYKETYPATAGIMKPGVYFEEILRECLKNGEIKNIEGSEEAWLANRLWRHGNCSVPFEQKLEDGRFLRIIEYKTKDGGIVGIRQDITELKKTEENLTRSQARLTDAIESLGDAFSLFDANDLLITSNSKYREIYASIEDVLVPGMSFETIIRTAVERGLYPDAVGREEEWITHRMGLHRTEGMVSEQKLADGRWIRVLERRTSEGGIAGSRVDITEMVNAKLNAQAANRAKSEFLATMSHEIRTPITGAMGFADMLMDDDLPELSKKKVQKIRETIQSLLQIINEVLDISKLEAGKMEIECLDFHVPSLVRDAVTLIAGSGRENLAVELTIADDFPQAVRGDPTRVRQVLINLVGNAVKFTKSGKVTVQAELQSSGDGQPVLYFAILDTGIGIPKEVIPNLFSDFTQADASITREFEGTGLGLSICKRLVGLMGGEIGVDSELGVGSTFWFTLPYLPATSEVSEYSLKYGGKVFAGGVSRALKILVAEDNQINQVIIAQTLESFGHVFEMVGNGEEAVKALEANDYDLIVMDVRMPKISGPDATRMIRQMHGHKGLIPIVALTADAMVEHQKGYFAAGMNAVATKPIDRDELKAAINDAMGEDIHLIANNDSVPLERVKESEVVSSAVSDFLKSIVG